MTEYQVDAKIVQFIERLRALDPGGRAQLKRSAGQPLPEASGGALRLFYSLLPPAVPRYQEPAYFLLATLFPLADDGGSGNFGAALRRARKSENAPGLDRRVEVLLDADEIQLPFRLRQATRFVASNQARVDWTQLLDDLLQWTHPSRRVQQNWARGFYAD